MEKSKLLQTIVLLFCTIAVFMISVFFVFLYQVHQQKEDGSIINTAGRQRILSQKMVKTIVLLSSDDLSFANVSFADLKTDLQEFKKNNEILINAKKSEKVNSLFQNIQPECNTFLLNIEKLISDTTKFDTIAYKTILNSDLDYLNKINTIVFQFVDDYYSKIRFFRNLIVFGSILTFLLFLFIIWRIVPIIKQHEKTKEILNYQNIELQKSNATKDKFFAIIAHDLRSPLSGLVSLAEIITDNNYQIEDLKEILNSFKETSLKTYNLLENLLLWAKTQRNEIEFNPDIYSINSIFGDNVKLISEKAKNRNIKIILQSNKDLKAFFDYNMIDTVVRNLLNNAMKFTTQNGSITISAKKEEMLTISIEDTGIGMSKELADNLFRIDVKHHSREGTSGEKGTGLGLILCKKFIERNGRKIWTKSEIDFGTTISFIIPISNKKIY